MGVFSMLTRATTEEIFFDRKYRKKFLDHNHRKYIELLVTLKIY